MFPGTGGSVGRAHAIAMRLALAGRDELTARRSLELLPFAAQRRVGFALGGLIRRLPLAYVRIARRNIDLCMPEWSAAARAALLDRHCESLGMALCETANTWWSSASSRNASTLAPLARSEGSRILEF